MKKYIFRPRQALLSPPHSENVMLSGGLQKAAPANQHDGDAVFPSAEAAQLRMRVIALENLMIALLAKTADDQVVLALEMALFISPRPGYTEHELTLRAASQMRSLIDRAYRFRLLAVA